MGDAAEPRGIKDAFGNVLWSGFLKRITFQLPNDFFNVK
jgi:hypothetical protein